MWHLDIADELQFEDYANGAVSKSAISILDDFAGDKPIPIDMDTLLVNGKIR